MKLRRGHEFANSAEIENNLVNFLNSLTPVQLEKEFEDLKQHLLKIIEADGDYIK